ncbi:MAG: hypothetical protein LWW93_13890 [Hyphomicrobiales bacterium]|nr:hypothetical protein [Hyphomicrobiales bacterium]
MLVIARRLPLALALLGSIAAPSLASRAAEAPAVAPSPAAIETVPAAPETVAPAAPAAEVRVDESALRYYASQRATTRVEAEIRRLRALYPGWEPPADLYRPGASDEQALWDLYGKDQIDRLKLEIERRTARQPGWRPSQDLVDKLRRKELRLALVKASDAGDWNETQKIAEREPLLLGDGDLDVTWRVAEAAAHTGAHDRALELYHAALAGAKSRDERLGAVRKAVAALGAKDAVSLLSEEKIGPDGKGEFEPLRLDLARAALGDWLKTEAAGAPPAADLERVVRAAGLPDAAADDALLLGWVDHRRKDFAAAERWFDLAGMRGGGAKAVLGGVVARVAHGRRDEAATLAMTALDDAEVASQFLDLVASDLTRPKPPAIAADRLARFAELTEKLESGDAAQALGWYAHGARQYHAAAAWFAKAMAWRPSVKSAEGHLLALKALHEKTEFARLDADYRGRFPDLPALRFDDPARRAAAAAPRAKACPARLAEGLGPAREASQALALGWCLMEAKRAEEAAVAFEAARRGDGRAAAEAAYGQALAHLRSGRTADAARVAASGGLAPARRDEIGRIVLAQQAIAHFDHEDWRSTLDTLDRRRAHAAEPRDLMAMRGWSLYHLGRLNEAHDVFVLLDGQLSTRESRAGLAATSPLAYRR